MIVAFPFIKWAGGKRHLLSTLKKYIPNKFNTYFEPFIGSGALFFYLLSQGIVLRSFISDSNNDLINCYRVIKYDVRELISTLSNLQDAYRQSPKACYYKIRAMRSLDNVEKAARFIFLNKTCYNGLYRVNRQGEFNVPMGNYTNPLIFDKNNLLTISKILEFSDTFIQPADYRGILLTYAKKGDFVYLDPPYYPINKTSNFTNYTAFGFDKVDQYHLYNVFKILDYRGCKILLSNSNTEFIRNLYFEYDKFIVEVPVNRIINCIGSKRRSNVSELLVKNYH